MGPGNFDKLHVIGDSDLILRQLRNNTPPRNQKLRPLYTHARLLTKKLGVISWRHYYRAHNNMADYLANMAMDECASAQDLFPSSKPAAEWSPGPPAERHWSLVHYHCCSFFFITAGMGMRT